MASGAGPKADAAGLRRGLAGLALALWLGGGAVALVNHGPWATSRIAVDPEARGAFGEAWGGGALGGQLNALERLITEPGGVAERGYDVVLLQRREGVNPAIGLATQLLFPTLVVPAWPKELDGLAAETGAAAVLRFEPGQGWTCEELGR